MAVLVLQYQRMVRAVSVQVALLVVLVRLRSRADASTAVLNSEALDVFAASAGAVKSVRSALRAALTRCVSTAPHAGTMGWATIRVSAYQAGEDHIANLRRLCQTPSHG
jgi:hypothetical protein